MIKGPVTQQWTHDLTFMQQSVLLTALRGPDGIAKDHVAKLLIRWLRRCVLLCSFGGVVLERPYDNGPPQGGSFTGPSLAGPGDWQGQMTDLAVQYLKCVDELPHHFQLHFMHAAEILGYRHPDPEVNAWWRHCYHMIVNDMHLVPEPAAVMDKRLGDREADWRAAEVVTASGPDEAAAIVTEPGIGSGPAARCRRRAEAIGAIAAERMRQVEVEGWTAEHDDEHDDGSMAQAAACYALFSTGRFPHARTWPWRPEWWKPKDRRRDLVRAGALIVAEIERLDRAAERAGAAVGPGPGPGNGGGRLG